MWRPSIFPAEFAASSGFKGEIAMPSHPRSRFWLIRRPNFAVRKTLLPIAMLIGLSTGTRCIAADAPTMTVGGALDVTSTGAASYSVPIVVPPGTASLVPTLSLNYSSQAGNGILGFGWSLAGLPSISRCPRTQAQDGIHGSVNYDANDRFCIDGKRLLVISGTYGADGSEYRTEIETFSRIIAHSTAGSGPGWFEVHTKSGQIIELGYTTDSRILPVNVGGGTKSSVRVWAADKISDTAGNYLKITYVNDTTNGQYYPDHIVYTGNDGASLTPYNSVYFFYTARTDATPLYHAGTVMQTTVLLSHIKTYTNAAGTGAPVTDYQLTYQLGNAAYYQLISLTRCDGSGGCLAPTTFGWTDTSGWATRIVVDSMPALPISFLNATQISGDLNGDGVPDGFMENGNCTIASGTAEPLYGVPGNGFVHPGMTMSAYQGTPIPACIFANPQSLGQFGPSPFIDFNGDGFIDVVSWGLQSGTGVLLNNGVGNLGATQYTYTLPAGVIANGNNAYGDFDSDGRADWFDGVLMTGGSYHTWLSKGDGSFAQGTAYSFGSSSNYAYSQAIGDIDGDGCADLLVQNVTNEVVLSCQPAVATIPFPNEYNVASIYTGDVNGDGNTDILTFPLNGTNATLNVSTGTSFIQTTVNGLSCGACGPQAANGIFFGDFDGDGKTDVAMVVPHYLEMFTWQSGNLALALTVNVDLPQVGCTGFCPPGYNGTIQVADVDGDGCSDLVISQTGSAQAYWYVKFGCRAPLLMTTVANGIGAANTIHYQRLNTNQPLYTKCLNSPSSYVCGDTYPTQAVDGPIYVVSEIDTTNGVGGNFTTTYAYAGAKNDLSGRGFLGYQQVTATNQQTHVVEATAYNVMFPLTGTVLEKKRTLNGTVLSDTINAYTPVPAIPALGVPTYIYLSASTVSGHEIDGTALPTTTTLNSNPDGYGNMQNVSVTVSDGSSKSMVNTYSNDTTHWFIGRLLSTTVTSTVGSSTMTRTSTFTYDPNTGILNQEVIEPNATTCLGTNSRCKLETDYQLDLFGQHHVTTVSGYGFANRVSTVNYGTNETFATSAVNPANQSDSFDYSGANGTPFGAPTSHTDRNGLVTTFGYDTFGREVLKTLPGTQGVKTATSFQYCTGINGGTATCPTSGAYLVQVTPYAHNGTTQDGPMSKTYYDALSRVVAVDVQGYDASSQTGCTSPCWIRTETNFDGNGDIHTTSRPYFLSTGTPAYTTYQYDAVHRAVQVTTPDGGITTDAYTGLGNAGSRVTVTNSIHEVTTRDTNAQGLVSAVTNALSKTTAYVYDAYGDLLAVTDPVGNQITNTFDIRGFKLSTSDPDLGLWTYQYDALGEPLVQIDPNERAASQTAAMTYDSLGRLTARTAPDQSDTWTYDTATHGAGLLQSTTGSNAGYSRTHTYDSLSRSLKVTLVVNGKSAFYTRTYNSDGRIATLTYPSGFVAKYVYTPLGYLQQIQDNSNGTVLWQANVRDAEQHLKDQVSGSSLDTIQAFDPNNGLVTQVRATNDGQDDGSVTSLNFYYDKLGNLQERADSFGATEYFCYDQLNRLTNYAVGGTSCYTGTSGLVKTTSYDDIGDIVSKSDLSNNNGGGTYSYPQAGQPLVHAVSSINGTVNGVVHPKYKYDANGNLMCIFTGNNCGGTGVVRETDTWWSFDMMHTVSEGGTGMTLTYDSEHARLTRTLTYASTIATTTYLNDPVSGAESESVVVGPATTWNDYVLADGRLIGERTCVSQSTNCTATPSFQYFVSDHLGSIAVVTDSSGNNVVRQSYDAWGRQRNENGSDDATCSLGLTSPTTRGFTSQEEIASLCLVDLNARLYDPTLGRFLSADSKIPDPYDVQTYNRYSYVNNRPLSLTDPTGNDPMPGPCGIGCIQPPIPDGDKPDQGSPGKNRPPPTNPAEVNKIWPSNGPGRFWVDHLTSIGARNVSVSLNPNGNLALNFTCSGGDTGCIRAGQRINQTFGGTETYAGGESTAAASYAQGDSSGDTTPGHTVIFIGGAGDHSMSDIIGHLKRDYERAHPGDDVQYYTWDKEDDIVSYIKGLDKNTVVTIIGHSWGGDTGAEVALALPGRIGTLITLDPVSLLHPSYEKSKSVTTWIDVNATGGSSLNRNNVISGLGRDWGTGPKEVLEDHYLEANVNHGGAPQMLQKVCTSFHAGC